MKKIKLYLILFLFCLASYGIDNKRIKEATETSGGTFTVTSNSSNQIIRLKGSPSLVSNYQVINDTFETAGMTIQIENMATPTLAGGHVYLFNTQIPDYLVAKKWVATCICHAVGSWYVYISEDFSQTSIVDSSKIKDYNVTNHKIAAASVSTDKFDTLTRGFIWVGNSSARPVSKNFKTLNYLAGGNGTDFVSLPVSTQSDVYVKRMESTWYFNLDTGVVYPIHIATACVGSGLTGGYGSAIAVKPNTTNGTSIAVSSNGVQLTNDATAPGVSKYYGTDATGTKGYFNFPSATSGEVKLVVPSASVLTLYSVPLQIIPNPGVGKAIIVESAFVTVTYNSAAYTTNTALCLTVSTADNPEYINTYLLLQTKTATQVFSICNMSRSLSGTQILSNQALMLTVADGNPTTGDSPITVYVKYRIVTL